MIDVDAAHDRRLLAKELAATVREIDRLVPGEAIDLGRILGQLRESMAALERYFNRDEAVDQ